MSAWIDLTPELTKEGQDELEPGQVLFFSEGEHGLQLKIMRKAKGKVWAKQVYMYKPEEIFVKDKLE